MLSLTLVMALMMPSLVVAAEATAMEKLCAGYAKKKQLLQKRLKRGTRAWERPRIQAQIDKINADSARHCTRPAPSQP